MAGMYSAEILLKWQDGKTQTAGTIDIEIDKDGLVKANIKRVNWVIGWEFVRKGLHLIFHRIERE